MLNGAPRPRTPEERELERVQKQITQGELAAQRRRELVVSLYRSGMPQVEIAARLSRAAVAVGGEPIGIDLVQKVWAKNRYTLRRG